MSVQRRIAAGAAWMVLFKIVDRMLGVVSTVILARLLVPADFGLVAMAMSVIALLELMSAFGFDVALIQKQSPSRADFNTAWTLNLSIALCVAAMTAALAVPVAGFYGEPRLVEVMLVLGLGWLIVGFENIGVVEFRRNMDFRSEFLFMAARRLIAFVIGLAAAFALRTYWALVIGMVAGRVGGVVLSYAMHSFRPRLCLSSARDLVRFSSGILVVNALAAGLARVPHFFVGRLHGPEALGAYTLGSELAYMPSNELIAPINRAVFPGYSRLTNDVPKLREAYLDVASIIALVTLPASVGVAVIADPLVRVLLGTKWLDAVPVIQILAAAGAIAAIGSNNGSAYMALGRTWLLPGVLAFRLVVMVAAMFVLAPRFGVLGVAYAEVVAYVLGLLVSFPVLFRAMRVSVSLYFASLWRPVVASALMGLCVFQVTDWVGSGSGSLATIPQLAAGVVTGVTSYAALAWMLWRLSGKPRGAESLALTQIAAMLQRFRPAQI
jgi:lipopolysaccharide exporter